MIRDKNIPDLVSIIKKFGFIITKHHIIGNRLVINFRDPRLEDDIFFTSAVFYDLNTKYLEALVRILLRGYRELYMDYCVEDCEMSCRPHFYYDDVTGRAILSVQAKWHTDVITRFTALLNELSPKNESSR